MAYPAVFFRKSYIDHTFANVTLTASQADNATDYLRDRSLFTAWMTTGSVDADNTSLILDWTDSKPVTDIILVECNFKAYTIQYWDGASYVDFATPISVTGNATATVRHSVTSVSTSKIKIIITGTFVADDDKEIKSLIVTDVIGTFNDEYPITKVRFKRNQSNKTTINGAYVVSRTLKYYGATIKLQHCKDDDDLTLIETLYDSEQSFIFWPCGGTEQYFSTVRYGWRLEDFFYCKTLNDYEPVFVNDIFSNGIALNMELGEVIE